MIDVREDPLRSRRYSRRTALRIGALAPFASGLGLSLPTLLRAASTPSSGSASFGRAKRCLMIYMWGGPSHIDLFDMKPNAPSDIRGEFTSRRTNVPGVRICEHLPHLAKHADKIGFIRSVTHNDNAHSTSAHWMMTGHKHEFAQENFGARRSDFPHIGSVVSKFSPTTSSLPPFVALPQVIGTTAGFVTPGQNAGFLGGEFDPFRINQFPDKKDFKVSDLSPVEGLSNERMESRLGLLEKFDFFRKDLEQTREIGQLDAIQQNAFDLVTSSQVRDAFDLSAEGERERERYGMHPFGQSILLSRRLLESGVKLATVYWHRDQSGADTTWDTHSNNFNQLRDRLIPQVDRPIAMLLEDLKQRGLLDDTLVLWTSEFGRSPKINKRAGRDHWGKCNTVWMAGAGIPGGQMYGETDSIASEPISDPVAPADLSATVFHLLGLKPTQRIHDGLDRPFNI